MSTRIAAVAAGLLLAGALAAVAPPAAAEPRGHPEEEVAELRKRVAKLEAEVAEMRQALLRAGGAPVAATDLKNLKEVARLRAADLLERTRDVREVLREVTGMKLEGNALNARINDLNNDLSGLWYKLAGYGLGADPYPDYIRSSRTGSGVAKPGPDYGIPGPHPAIGLPRLHERFLEAVGAKGEAAEKAAAEFRKLVKPYSKPGRYPHREFYDRAYDHYRNGTGHDLPQYAADLKAVDQWLADLEAALEKVPGFFDKAP